MAMAEADWSELPKDVLNLISQRFDNDLDLIRFRSVCSTWRRFSISNQHNHILPFKLPYYSTSSCWTCSLSKHILLLIKPPRPQQEQEILHRPWLIRITKNKRDETQLLHPLRPGNSLSPYNFPYVLDINKFSVVHLGTDFVIDRNKKNPTIAQQTDIRHLMRLLQQRELQRIREKLRKKGVRINTRKRKVAAATCRGKKPLALGALDHKGRPVLFHCRKKRWKLIPCMSTYFVDISMFKDQFYAVNRIGQTVAFGPDYRVQLVAEYVDGGDMKFLVESEGELLLVDIYDSHRFGFPGEDGLRFDVFTLDEKEKKWVKLTSLGDRILFLGNEYSFSASVSDLSVAKGNCVIFIDDAFNYFDDMQCGMCVFHLDQRRLSPLSDNPDYFNLFWPPPEWIIKMLQHS